MPSNSIPRDARGAGVALALASAAGFSVLGIFAKLVYAEGLSVPEALAWRFTVAAAVLWLYVLLTRRRLPKPVLPVLLLGLLGFAPQAGLYFATIRILDPGITSLLLYTYPSFVVLFSFLFLRKRPTKLQLAALALSLAGCAATFWKRGDYPLGGLLLGILVGLAYGVYLVAGEGILKEVDSISATAVIMLVAALVYWILAAGAAFRAGRVPAVPATPAAIGGILGLSVISTVIPITTLFAAMRRIGAADASLVSTLEPVLTVGLSALLLGERLGPARLVGGGLILAAVVALNLPARPAKAAGKAA
ncbi:MAG: DMT family transporter [Spirochaetaceae bacterium]|nr:DMT family transporter [Spirochaetaceae bacterium]